MTKSIPTDQLVELVKQATHVAIEMVAEINKRTIDNSFYYLFSDITASYILAYSYLATYLQSVHKNDPALWGHVKNAAHESLDIAFKSVEKNLPLYEEKLTKHANH